MNAAERRLIRYLLALFLLDLVVEVLPRLWAEPLAIEPGAWIAEESPVEIPDRDIVRTGVFAGDPTGERKTKSRTVKQHISKTKPLLINSADSSQLLELPGIGPAMAHRILEHRRHHGPLRGPQDLELVPGIGKKKLEKLVALLIFD